MHSTMSIILQLFWLPQKLKERCVSEGVFYVCTELVRPHKHTSLVEAVHLDTAEELIYKIKKI